MKYDGQVLHAFALRRYRQAARTVILFTVFGGLSGFAAGAIGGSRSRETDQKTLAFAMLFVGVGIGWLLGSDRAFRYRLEAQTALCQAQIEENTRQR